MATTPLMPKATAVWLVENTALSFDQIADFCKLHPLEVKAIADGDAAQGIKGLDPVLTGQLTREEIEKAEADHDQRLHISDPKVRLPEQKKKKGPRYTPVSRRQDRPNAILWLVRNHPELKDAQIMRLVGTTKSTIAGHPRAHALERRAVAAARSGDARPVHADRSRFRGAARREGKARDRGSRRDAAAGRGHHRRGGSQGRGGAGRQEEGRRSRRQHGVREAQAARQSRTTRASNASGPVARKTSARASLARIFLCLINSLTRQPRDPGRIPHSAQRFVEGYRPRWAELFTASQADRGTGEFRSCARAAARRDAGAPRARRAVRRDRADAASGSRRRRARLAPSRSERRLHAVPDLRLARRLAAQHRRARARDAGDRGRPARRPAAVRAAARGRARHRAAPEIPRAGARRLQRAAARARFLAHRRARRIHGHLARCPCADPGDARAAPRHDRAGEDAEDGRRAAQSDAGARRASQSERRL